MEEQPMQIVNKYSSACLSLNHPSHLCPGDFLFVVDQAWLSGAARGALNIAVV
jgi:hypothetical protein